MSFVRDMFGRVMISLSSFIYDLSSGWLSGEEEAPDCLSKNEKGEKL